MGYTIFRQTQLKETTQEKFRCPFSYEIHILHLRQSHFLEAHLNSNQKCLCNYVPIDVYVPTDAHGS